MEPVEKGILARAADAGEPLDRARGDKPHGDGRPNEGGTSPRHKKAMVKAGLLSGAAAALTVGLVGSASAAPRSILPGDGQVILKANTMSMTKDHCTVWAKKPWVHPTLDTLGRKQVHYPVTWKCDGGRRIEVKWAAREQDNGKPGDVGNDDTVKSF